MFMCSVHSVKGRCASGRAKFDNWIMRSEQWNQSDRGTVNRCQFWPRSASRCRDGNTLSDASYHIISSGTGNWPNTVVRREWEKLFGSILFFSLISYNDLISTRKEKQSKNRGRLPSNKRKSIYNKSISLPLSLFFRLGALRHWRVPRSVGPSVHRTQPNLGQTPAIWSV